MPKYAEDLKKYPDAVQPPHFPCAFKDADGKVIPCYTLFVDTDAGILHEYKVRNEKDFHREWIDKQTGEVVMATDNPGFEDWIRVNWDAALLYDERTKVYTFMYKAPLSIVPAHEAIEENPDFAKPVAFFTGHPDHPWARITEVQPIEGWECPPVIWEKEVKPVLDTTNMNNKEWRTQVPKQLKALTEVTVSRPFNPPSAAKCAHCGSTMVIIELPMKVEGQPVFAAICSNSECKSRIHGYTNFPDRKTPEDCPDCGAKLVIDGGLMCHCSECKKEFSLRSLIIERRMLDDLASYRKMIEEADVKPDHEVKDERGTDNSQDGS